MCRAGIHLALLFLLMPMVSWGVECNNEAATFGRSQIVTKGMLDLTLAGKMNHATSNDIGEQMKIAQAHSKNSEYQKSCDVYDAVIAKYGFKTFEESYYEKYPEKRPGNQSSPQPAAAATSGTAVAADEAATSE